DVLGDQRVRTRRHRGGPHLLAPARTRPRPRRGTKRRDDVKTDSIHDQRPPHAGTRPPRLSEVPAFVDHIARGWGQRSVPVGLPEGTAAAAAEHRRRLSDVLPGRAIVAAAGSAPIRNDDNAYGFRADSDFVWLTGVQVEGAVLVMTPTAGGPDAGVY